MCRRWNSKRKMCRYTVAICDRQQFIPGTEKRVRKAIPLEPKPQKRNEKPQRIANKNIFGFLLFSIVEFRFSFAVRCSYTRCFFCGAGLWISDPRMLVTLCSPIFFPVQYECCKRIYFYRLPLQFFRIFITFCVHLFSYCLFSSCFVRVRRP